MTKSLALALVTSTALWACNKEKSSKTDTPEPEPVTAKKASTPPEAARAIMAPYEVCRAKLADDQSDVAGCAAELAAAARANQPVFEGEAAAAAGAMASAADALAKMPADDIETLRTGFGEVSKPVQTLLASTPEVAAKYKMYECPMAKGFSRWAQPDEGAMANPYMGKKMLECGSEIHDHHGSGGAAGGKDDLVAAEMKAHEAAKPLLDKYCASCHTTAGKGSKKAKKKALAHFAMDSYPYTGHHAHELGKEIREVLGVGGEEATMPADDPGSVQGEELARIVAWTEALDKAAEAKVGHHGETDHSKH